MHLLCDRGTPKFYALSNFFYDAKKYAPQRYDGTEGSVLAMPVEGRMGTLGELERTVMDAIWDAAAPITAYDVQDRLAARGRNLAATTLLTVLSRLGKKGFVVSDRSARPHRYGAVGSREDHVAELMHSVLGGADDRGAVLARFLGGVSAEDADVLRRLLSTDPD